MQPLVACCDAKITQDRQSNALAYGSTSEGGSVPTGTSAADLSAPDERRFFFHRSHVFHRRHDRRRVVVEQGQPVEQLYHPWWQIRRRPHNETEPGADLITNLAIMFGPELLSLIPGRR